jgi:hypothetical protein
MNEPCWVLKCWKRRAIYALVLVEAIFWASWSYWHLPVLGFCFSVMKQGGTHDPVVPRALVICENGVLRVCDHYSDDAERAVASPRPGEVVRGQLLCSPAAWTWGLLGPAFKRYEHTLYDISSSGSLSPAELAQARPLYVAFLAARLPGVSPEYLTLLSAGDGTTRRIQWGWLLHDALIGALLVWALASSIASLGPTRARLKAERSTRRLAHNQCPECGYDIVGLAKGQGCSCPECGRQLTP